MRGPDDPVNLLDCYDLLPNIFIGMHIQVKGMKYRVTDVSMIVDKEFCRQIIFVKSLL